MRVQSIKAMRAAGKNPYPHKFHVSMSLTDFIEKYSSLEAGLSDDTTRISLAGLLVKLIVLICLIIENLKVVFTPNVNLAPS